MAITLVLAFLIVAILYFYWNRHEPLDKHAIFATVFMVAFLVTLFLLESMLPDHQRIKVLFVVLPLVSYGAVLFPEMNSNMSVTSTKAFGWFGLLVTAMILIGFEYNL